jgi:hypothetical protein
MDMPFSRARLYAPRRRAILKLSQARFSKFMRPVLPKFYMGRAFGFFGFQCFLRQRMNRFAAALNSS